MLCKTFDLDFWPTYEDVRSGDDQRAYIYDFDEIANLPPVAKRRTEDYLCITGDDRAYWRREGGDVVFSDKMRDWLKTIRRRFDELCDSKSELPFKTSADFRCALADVLTEEHVLASKVYMFRDTFFEFISEWKNRHVQIALVLLQQLVGEIATSEQQKDDIEWIRKYIAVLANVELRNKAFGF